MKTKQFYIGLGAVAAIVAVIALANQAGLRNATAQELEEPALQTQEEQLQTEEEQLQVGELEEFDVEHAEPGLRASQLIGMNVRGKDDEERNIGTIDDLMISHDGEVLYVAVSYGGFLGIGDRLVAVPMDSLEIVQREEGVFIDPSYARLDATEEQLRQTEGFDRDNWPQQADARFHRDGERHVERPGLEPDVTR